MPLQATSGAASYDAFGGGAAAKVNYIEDFFQTYLRTGTGASATVTTGLNGSTKETLVWTKSRSAATDHKLTDNVRGATKALSSNTTGAEATDSQGLTAFSATGYTIGTNTDYNSSGATYVDWQWVAQPKFFDVVTYTGNNTAGRTVAHNLGSAPGCMIVKATVNGAFGSGAYPWQVYHRDTAAGMGPTKFMVLNSTAAESTGTDRWNSTDPTSTVFTLGNAPEVNESGVTYVAYLFAHDAGGFGLTGTDNVISCGSFTTDGSGNATVSLGYEPQWMMLKTTGSGGWFIRDTMRGFVADTSGTSVFLRANTADAEGSGTGNAVTATGTQHVLAASTTYIYIAIRRGPMKVPTDGTSVFSPFIGSDASTITTGFPVDMLFDNKRAGNSNNTVNASRLVGENALITSSTAAETAGLVGANCFQNNTGYLPNALGTGIVAYAYQRAPSFFDEVCWTTTQTGFGITAITHNLGVVPELIITKARNTSGNWMVRVEGVTGNTSYLRLNSTDALTTFTLWGTPTTTTFSEDEFGALGSAGTTAVAYLFATCPGVSKVGSYTGDGTDGRIIDCGFTSGARFVLIKSTSNTGNWWVWDTARGIVSANDPVLRLNTTAAESTNSDDLDPSSSGFIVNYNGLFAINESGWSYIFLAIA